MVYGDQEHIQGAKKGLQTAKNNYFSHKQEVVEKQTDLLHAEQSHVPTHDWRVLPARNYKTPPTKATPTGRIMNDLNEYENKPPSFAAILAEGLVDMPMVANNVRIL